MGKKKYYYTVWKGLQTGVFDNWEECSQRAACSCPPVTADEQTQCA